MIKKCFILSFFCFIILFMNLSRKKTYLIRQLDENNDIDDNENKKCKGIKCSKNWEIVSFIFLIILSLLFILIIICNIYNCLRGRGISSYDPDYNMNANEINVKKKHYLFQNDLNWQIYDNNIKQYGNECTICIDTFIENKIRVCLTPCHHVFHFSCLKDYILKSNDTHCPNCKFDFFSLLEDKNIDFKNVEIDDNLPNDNIDDDNKDLENNELVLNVNNNNNPKKSEDNIE